MDLSNAQAVAHLPAKISACLEADEPRQAMDFTVELIRCPEALRQSLPGLEREFRKSKQLVPLIELLWASKDTALKDVFVIGLFMRLCTKAGQYERFGPLLRAWIAA